MKYDRHRAVALVIAVTLLASCDLNRNRTIVRQLPRAACSELTPQPTTAKGHTLVNDTTGLGEYQPGRIRDVAIDRATRTIYILDSFQRTVVRISPEGNAVTSWGKQGRGPGEFADPQAIAVASGNVHVLDGDGTVSVFDSTGLFLRDVRTWMRGDDLAVLTTGDFVIAAEVRAFSAASDAVVVFDSTGRKKATLVAVDPHEYGQRPFTGPTGTRLRLFAGDSSRVAVAYTSDNSIDVFEHDRLMIRIRGCLPSAVRDSYQQQLDRNRRVAPQQRSMAVRDVINAVLIHDGGLVVGNPGGWDRIATITQYDNDGRPVSVSAFNDTRSLQFAAAAEFLDAHTLVAWEDAVWKWDVDY